jgi:hypothetical protein
MFNNRNTLLWILWIVLTIGLTMYYVIKINDKASDKSVFLPGETSHGHYQIELACESCHSEQFTDAEAIQESCMNCHGQALKIARDKHPKSKFTDPRNADRLEKLDARYCVTCHVEHRPEITLDMGLTMPLDYCQLCHEDIAEDRPSHKGMAFDTCASAGCHNYHDNQALYEDYLVKHLHEPDILEKPGSFPELNLEEIAPVIPGYPIDKYPFKILSQGERDVPTEIKFDQEIVYDWFETAHAESGVNCTACHNQTINEEETWVNIPDYKVCSSCHSAQIESFKQGKHGMRLDTEKLKRELSPMSPALSRLPMKHEAMDKELTCNSCHTAHRYDTKKARVEQCLTCHNDEHSLAYIDSPHHELWKKELAGELPEGSGVTCATCHMPRIEQEFFDGDFYLGLVQHNQNDTLKPNEKMLRPVCMNCHGLSFGINSLADESLIKNNFSGKPSIHIKGMELAEKRMLENLEKKKRLREQQEQNEE